jgi:HD superfamily phosphodiesterase
MSWKKWYEIFLKEFEESYKDAPFLSDSHRADHVRRVWRTSRKLCGTLGGDLEVMVAATLLHDLGRHYRKGVHGPKSAEMARPILDKYGFPAEKRDSVLEAIRYHDHKFPPSKRKSIEAKILCDADRMDAFGVVGVQRHILFINQKRMTLDETLPELKKRWDSLMLDESRKLAKPDYDYIVGFFKTLKKELGKG